MTGTKKIFLFLLGLLSSLFILAQLVLGLAIVFGGGNPWIRQNMGRIMMSHQHTGYTTVALVLAYIIVSLVAIARVPTLTNRDRSSDS